MRRAASLRDFDRLIATVTRRRPTRARRPVQHEKGEQAGGIKLLRTLGATVYTFGTRRSRGKACPRCGTFVPEHQGTRQTPGIPDVFAFLPARNGKRVLLCWEAKRPFAALLVTAVTSYNEWSAPGFDDYVARVAKPLGLDLKKLTAVRDRYAPGAPATPDTKPKPVKAKTLKPEAAKAKKATKKGGKR